MTCAVAVSPTVDIRLPRPAAAIVDAVIAEDGEPVRIDRCYNVKDFRSLARRRLPGPIFHYIDGAASADEYEITRVS
jgi:hypothetical protein